ncbi:MAG: mechanosensitive ion channel family protein [Pirellulaceae bacterium]
MSWQQFLNWAEQFAWLKYSILGNSVIRWSLAAGVLVLAFFILSLATRLFIRRAKRFSEGTSNRWDDGIVRTLQATHTLFLLIVSAYLGTLLLELPPREISITRSVVIVALLLQVALWGNVLMEFAIERYMKARMETDAAAATTVSALSFVGKLLLWSVVALLALENMGVDVTALVAGLGVGGIAVALAAQNILGDLFASLSIVLDKPFVLGDFIIVGDAMGSVEKIGLKTTRLRSLSGEQLIFSNTDLLQSRVRNFKRMFERRVVFGIGVTYQTPREKLAEIPGMIRAIVESQEQIRFDRSHFKEFGDSALNFETVYYVLGPDYTMYMDIQQNINLALFEKFEQEGIEFAYPTQTLFLEKASTDS